MQSLPAIGALIFASLVPCANAAQDPSGATPSAPAAQQDLKDLSLEDLMNVEVTVTSAARHEEPLSKTPAAIFVLTADDIHRSGATSIPELLRLVPGVNVARLDANRWAVTIRGFNGQFANKLLVLVDGRSVYTPLFSGTWWDTLDVPLEEIERGEVIRGPGAALWGANAVNGIINIITKDSSQTLGNQVTTTIGDMDRFLGYARHGGELDDGTWRSWVRYSKRAPLEQMDGSEGDDEWDLFHAGFRIDRAPNARDHWTISGDAYSGWVNGTISVAAPAPQYAFTGADATDVWGANVQSRWTRHFGERDELSIQGFLEHTDRTLSVFAEGRSTLGLDLQRRQPLSDSQDLTWGAALRSSYSVTTNSFDIAWRDNHRMDGVASVFAQDEIVLEPERWKLTAGTKLEYGNYTGFQLQPDLRLLYTPTERVSWWASASRAARTPSQAEQDVQAVVAVVPGAPDQYVEYLGDRNVQPETLDAFEIGYRVRPAEALSFDATAFYNHYRDLIVYEPGAPFLSGANLVVPLTATNLPSADSYGAELAADWTPAEDSRLSLAWSLQKVQVDTHGSQAPDASDPTGLMPESQVRLRLSRDFADHFSFDSTLYRIERLQTGSIPGYWRMDASLEYRPDAQRSFAIGVQNLFHDDEPEFGASTFNPSSRMESGLYLRASWSF